MLRIVAYKKALMAGALGAVAWEAIARAFVMSRLPVFDIVARMAIRPARRSGRLLRAHQERSRLCRLS
jgi:hypothetical protein